MFMLEKVFQCRHAICNVCVQRFSSLTLTAKHSFTLLCCVLCGCKQPKDCRVFQLVPPTAGIRTLCIDGGGVRSVILLMFLKHLKDELNGLGGTVSDCFDYVCSTSAGIASSTRTMLLTNRITRRSNCYRCFPYAVVAVRVPSALRRAGDDYVQAG